MCRRIFQSLHSVLGHFDSSRSNHRRHGIDKFLPAWFEVIHHQAVHPRPGDNPQRRWRSRHPFFGVVLGNHAARESRARRFSDARRHGATIHPQPGRKRYQRPRGRDGPVLPGSRQQGGRYKRRSRVPQSLYDIYPDHRRSRSPDIPAPWPTGRQPHPPRRLPQPPEQFLPVPVAPATSSRRKQSARAYPAPRGNRNWAPGPPATLRAPDDE